MILTKSRTSNHRYRVLCVDENKFGVFVNATILRYEGYEVLACSDPLEAAALARSQEIDLAVVDYQMPGMNGAQLAASCKAANPDIKVILFSQRFGIPEHELALADLFVPKTEDIQGLLEGMEALLPQSSSQMEFASAHTMATEA